MYLVVIGLGTDSSGLQSIIGFVATQTSQFAGLVVCVCVCVCVHVHVRVLACLL